MFYAFVKCAIVLFLYMLLSACSKPTPPAFNSTDITGSSIGGEFVLIDQHGKSRSLSDFRGRVVVVFFGFTHCSDVCPITLAELNAVEKKLGANGKRLQVIFITVDPERDTPKVIAHYLSSFNPNFLGLSGDLQAVNKVATQFKIVHEKIQRDNTVDYRIDHSSSIYIFDITGRLRLYADSTQSADRLSVDIKLLLDGA